MANQRYTAAEVIKAIQDTAGIKTAAAKKLGCDVDTVDRYCNRYPSVADAVKQARSGIVDMAESVLIQKLNRKEWDAAKFVLTTLGKDRGWGNTIDVNVKIDEIARQLAAEYGEDEARIKAELLDLEAERRKRRVA